MMAIKVNGRSEISKPRNNSNDGQRDTNNNNYRPFDVVEQKYKRKNNQHNHHRQVPENVAQSGTLQFIFANPFHAVTFGNFNFVYFRDQRFS
jgi:hypothetical protein